MKSQRCAVLICDDVSRIPLRPPFLRKFILARMAIALARRANGFGRIAEKVLLVANQELFGKTAPSAKLVEPARVTIGGAVTCDETALLAFSSRASGRLSEGLKNTEGEGLGELTEMRLFIGPLLEYLVRPAEGLAAFFREEKVTDVHLFSGTAALERIAAGVAEDLSLVSHRAPLSAWNLFFRLRHAFWSRNRFQVNYEALARSWAECPRAATNAEPEDVIIFAEEERRLRRLGPMAKAMLQAGLRVRVVGVPFKKEARTALEELRAQGIRTTFLSNYLKEDPLEIAEKAEPLLKRSWKNLEQDPHVNELRYRRVPIWHIFRKHFQKSWFTYALAGWYSKKCAAALLKAHAPRKLIVMEVGLYSQALLNAAKKQGIESFWYANNPILFTVPFWLPVTFRTFRADKVIVTGEHMREQLIARGFYRADQIITSGDMNLPNVERSESAADELRKKWGLAPGRKAVLCLSSFLGLEVSVEKLRRFHQEAAALAKDCGAALLIKAHPNQNPEGLKGQLASWGVKYDAFFHTEPLMELLSASDLAIMMFSQAGAEVLMAGVPLVILQEEGMAEQFDALFPYVREGAATLLLMGASDNSKQVQALLGDPSVRDGMKAKAERFVNHFVSVRHPDNAVFLAEQLKI